MAQIEWLLEVVDGVVLFSTNHLIKLINIGQRWQYTIANSRVLLAFVVASVGNQIATLFIVRDQTIFHVRLFVAERVGLELSQPAVEVLEHGAFAEEHANAD